MWPKKNDHQGRKSRTRRDFAAFRKRIADKLLAHRIIADNAYCRWFAESELDVGDVRHFLTQFSVFSNLFLVAQLKKMINAVDLEEMHKAKEILANEIGCILRRPAHGGAHKHAARGHEGEPGYVSVEGTVDGGTFRFRAAHFEWLLDVGQSVGLGFRDLGRRSLGTRPTLFFCDELNRLYGSEDYNTSAGASFAVENWAAAGFWKQLTAGFKHFSLHASQKIPLGFFVWHDLVEDQHRQDTFEEVEQLYFGPHPFDEGAFLKAGRQMLDGVAAFWDGLDADRRAAAALRTGKSPASPA